MDQNFYKEMVENLNQLMEENAIQGKKIYLFGHCNATEELANLLLEKGFSVEGILDNNEAKHGNQYQGIEIQPPLTILKEEPEETLVCIAARAYAAMAAQLKRIGYKGMILPLAIIAQSLVSRLSFLCAYSSMISSNLASSSSLSCLFIPRRLPPKHLSIAAGLESLLQISAHSSAESVVPIYSGSPSQLSQANI